MIPYTDDAGESAATAQGQTGGARRSTLVRLVLAGILAAVALSYPSLTGGNPAGGTPGADGPAVDDTRSAAGG